MQKTATEKAAGIEVVDGFAQLQEDLCMVWQVSGCCFMLIWVYKFLFSRDSGRGGVRRAWKRE